MYLGLGLRLGSFFKSAKAQSSIPLQGLSLWLKADAGVALDGTNVTGWADQSGSANDAYPFDESPTYNSSDLNGKPSISLTSLGGTEKVFYLEINPLGESGSTAFSVQYVEDVCDAPDNNGPIFGNFGLSYTDEELAGSHYPYGFDCTIYDTFATADRKNGLTPPATITNAWSLYSVKSTNNDWESFVNGISVYADASNVYNNQVGGNDEILYIGKQTSIGSYAIKGKVAEVIVYNRVLTTQERQQVEGYLNAKYAIY